MKKNLVAISVILALLSVSCFKLGESEYYVKMTGRVEISHVTIPSELVKSDTARITARAQAYDGCWSNLYFQLDSTSAHEYILQAYGIYESYGSCPSVMVYGDTTILLKMKTAGTYIFYTYMTPEITQKDTLVVSEN
jgi:hypothetical protein